MRKLIVAAFTSLDGVMQAPGGPDEDTSGGFTSGGWVWPYMDESDEAMGGVFDTPFSLVLGRRTYDVFASYWPQAAADDPCHELADQFNAAAKYVATHRPESLDWNNSHGLGADVVGALRSLKEEDGPNLVTQGSSELTHALLATDLVDELHLLVFPVVLGPGKRIFDQRAQGAAFRLESSKTSAKGVLHNRYVRVGEVQTLPHPTA